MHSAMFIVMCAYRAKETSLRPKETETEIKICVSVSAKPKGISAKRKILAENFGFLCPLNPTTGCPAKLYTLLFFEFLGLLGV